MRSSATSRILDQFKRFKNLSFILTFTAVLITTFSFFAFNKQIGVITDTSITNKSEKSLVTQLANSKLDDINSYAGLPVKHVESYTVANPVGTVIYIPQYHKNPGTEINDKSNDAGEKTQQQIYHISSFLIDNFNIDFAMTEGQLYGEVPEDKLKTLAEKIQKRDIFISLSRKLEKTLEQDKLDLTSEKKFLTNLHSAIAEINREIILEGAVENLKAKGKNIKLYGTENPDTKEQSKLIVRDYVYLQDRIKELDQTASNNPKTVNLFTSNEEKSILKYLFSGKTAGLEFKPLEIEANKLGRIDLAQLIKKTDEAFYSLTKQTPNNIMISSSAPIPSRQDNPYSRISDKQVLKDKIENTKDQLKEVIIQKRNQETAQNFAKALKEQNKTTGILQFGAGHKEGLIKELNGQRINVIVVTPEEVFNRNNS